MEIRPSILLASALMLAGCASPPQHAAAPSFPPVAIDGDWFTVGGEKFLVVGVGYESCSRPGQAPWKQTFEPEVAREDFRRIRAAGFNTIRNWNAVTDKELDLAAEYGLWVIQGLWIKADADFNNPAFRKESLAFYERELTRLAKHPNIFCYLLLNEPDAGSVYRAGPENMNEFFKQIVELAHRIDPKRTVSYSNCVMTDFMKPTMWDFTAQNAYPYAPTTIDHALGYRGYIEQIKKDLAPGKPLLITEYGLSVSPHGDGRGYGGNSLEQQRDGVVRMTDELLAAGAAGYCTFMWSDGWWKGGSPERHDPGAEEWYGLLETDSDYLGKPRPVYYAMQDYNKAIRTLPRDGQIVGDKTEIEVWAPTAASVQYRLDEGPWSEMKQTGPWWRSLVSMTPLPDGPHYIWTRAANGGLKSAVVYLDRSGKTNADFRHVRIVDLPERVPVGTRLEVTVEVTDRDGKPVPAQNVRVDQFLSTVWDEDGVDVETDAQGRAVASLSTLHNPGTASIAAAVGYANGLYVRRYSDYRHLEVVPKQ